MSTGTASVSRLPGDHLVRREDLLEERVPREFVGHTLDPDARRQHRKRGAVQERDGDPVADRKSTRLNSSHSQISYAVFCLKKKKSHHTTAAPPAEVQPT